MLFRSTLLVSVGEGQIMEGKEAVLRNLKNGNDYGIKYKIEEITSKSYRIDNCLCHTIVNSTILTCYPDETLERVDQRVTVVWRYVKAKYQKQENVDKEGWYALQIHISLGRESRQEPVKDAHFSVNTLVEKLMLAQNEEKVLLRDVQAGVHYIPRSQIIRFEAADHQSIAMLEDGQELHLSRKLGQLELEFNQDFVRIHRCHLVNARYIKLIKNYRATLTDGTVLPIPKEIYRNVKQAVARANCVEK